MGSEVKLRGQTKMATCGDLASRINIVGQGSANKADRLGYFDAKAYCTNNNSTLAILTQEVVNAIADLPAKVNFWIGLEWKFNNCENEECDGDLRWSDNSKFAWEPYMGNIVGNNLSPPSCFAFSNKYGIRDMNCTKARPFICVDDC